MRDEGRLGKDRNNYVEAKKRTGRRRPKFIEDG